jgi:hypothetical protein
MGYEDPQEAKTPIPKTQLSAEQLCNMNARLADQLAAARFEIVLQRAVTLNGYQVKLLLEFVDSEDETEITVAYVDHERPDANSAEGEIMPAGLYVWCTDYPDEGSLYLPETPQADGDDERG